MPTEIISGNLLIRDNKIVAILQKDDIGSTSTNNVIDAKSNFVSPGFIETHCHGALGADFMDANADEVAQIASFHAKHGVTTLLATSTAAPISDIEHFITNIRAHIESTTNPTIYGIHLEGPYLNIDQSGAQNPANIYPPNPEQYMGILSLASNLIKRWSIAPEVDHNYLLCKECLKRKILVSAAHTSADYAMTVDAYNNGYKLLTHFYSGMNSVTRKKALRIGGAVEAGYLTDGLTVEVIADGKHLPAELLKLICRVKGADGIILTTDASSATGMDSNSTNLKIGGKSGLPIIIEDGVAKLPDRTSLAGSIATGDVLVRNMLNMTQATLPEVIRMLTLNPAKLLGIDSTVGSIAPGKQADLLIFDDSVNITKIIKNGLVL